MAKVNKKEKIVPNIYEIEEDITVSEFLSQFSFDETFTANKFLSLTLLSGKVRDSSGKPINVTNQDRIVAQYSKEELDEFYNKTASQVIIKKGTQVGLPNSTVQRKKNKIIPDQFDLSSYKPFIADQLKKLLRDQKYSSYITDNDTGEVLGRTDINEITVFAWIRSITDGGDTSQQGTWINLSAFVDTIQTTVNANTGSFAIQLLPISAKHIANFWTIENVAGYENGNTRDNIFSSTQLSKYKNKTDNFVSRQDFFVNTTMQENDLIYIRFERLANERENVSPSTLWSNDIPGNIYDMIGLVDSVTQSATVNNVTTTVQGRDLTKLLIEDGSYIFSEFLLPSMFTNKDSLLAKRNMLDSFGQQLNGITTFKPIDIILKYIFNKFSNIGIIPTSALSGYGDKLMKEKYQLKTSVLQNVDSSIQESFDKAFIGEKREGVWCIVDMVFDPNASKRVLADSTIATDQGSIINSINKMCQYPFVEFWGDTYGDKYYFNIRKPPFDKIGYRGMVYDDVVSEEVLEAGIGASDRILKRQKDKNLTLRANNGVADRISPLVISIDESEVFSESFSYHNDEAYSWYRLVPTGLGVSDTITSLKLCPVIALDEYARVWGNKCLDIEYNYTPIEYLDDINSNSENKYVVEQVFLDLKFLIESNSYLPFTRRGSIVISGNRTIKRGTFVYYKATDEIFYVDSVTNSRSLNQRTTTLQVSRGMREKFIKGVEIDFSKGKKKVSYFDIVPTPIQFDSLGNNQFLSKWETDIDLFNFFLQRRQWV